MASTLHKLTQHAQDSGTYLVDYTITAPGGGNVILSNLTWSLRIRSGEVVNGRFSVGIDPPASSGAIVLYGPDIAYSVGNIRHLTIEATYIDPVIGELPITAEYIFMIDNYLGIPSGAGFLEDMMIPSGILRGLSDTLYGNSNTSNLPEGINLYYTDARARAAISDSIVGITYTSATGVLSLDNGRNIPTIAKENN